MFPESVFINKSLRSPLTSLLLGLPYFFNVVNCALVCFPGYEPALQVAVESTKVLINGNLFS